MEPDWSSSNSEPLLIRRARLNSGRTVDLTLSGGLIAQLNGSMPAPKRVIEANGRLVSPGFVELQVNGAADVDFTANPRELWRGCATLGSQGITSVLPTIITSSAEVRRDAIATVSRRPWDYIGPKVLGLHFEGPWLAKARCGAHPLDLLAEPDLDEIAHWKHVRMVTLAPECVPEAVIEHLVDAGIVVACGHSEATFEQAKRAFDVGARYVTHLFNAMSPLHHRLPGLVGAALSDARVTVGLIADGVHVHPEAAALAFQLAAERLNLVSDAIALGAGPSLSGQNPTLVDGVPRLADGTLAGSALRLDDAVRNLRRFTGCSIPEALATVTTVPGCLLGLDQRIDVASPADLVILNDDLTVACTIADGHVIFEA